MAWLWVRLSIIQPDLSTVHRQLGDAQTKSEITLKLNCWGGVSKKPRATLQMSAQPRVSHSVASSVISTVSSAAVAVIVVVVVEEKEDGPVEGHCTVEGDVSIAVPVATMFGMFFTELVVVVLLVAVVSRCAWTHAKATPRPVSHEAVDRVSVRRAQSTPIPMPIPPGSVTCCITIPEGGGSTSFLFVQFSMSLPEPMGTSRKFTEFPDKVAVNIRQQCNGAPITGKCCGYLMVRTRKDVSIGCMSTRRVLHPVLSVGEGRKR